MKQFIFKTITIWGCMPTQSDVQGIWGGPRGQLLTPGANFMKLESKATFGLIKLALVYS